MAEDYTWTDNPITPTATAAPATWNECMMHLKYENSGAPSLTDYIVSGRKFTVGIDLNLTISAGENFISNASRTRAQNVLALTARRAQLIYDTKLGVTGKVEAAFPAANAGTVCRWIIDGSATIASTVGSNDLTKSGTVTQDVGWASDYAGKGNGSTGCYTSANSTGFPTGAAARELDVIFTTGTDITTLQQVAEYGAGGFFGVVIESGYLKIWNNSGSATVTTGYALEASKTYYVAHAFDGTTCRVYVNGELIYIETAAYTTTATVLGVFSQSTGANKFSGTIHYIEVRNAIRTAAQITAASNALLLSCRYYADASKPDFTDIRSILPTDAIGLGFVLADSDSIVEFNDADYKYGRREGAVGGNRKVFLGWKYFSGSTTLYWDNPFDTRKIKTTVVWAQDSNGTNESEIYGYYYNGSSNLGVLMRATTTKRITIATGDSACLFNGAWQSSGYIGCYAEVIE